MAARKTKQQIEEAKKAYEQELKRKKLIFSASIGGTLVVAITLIGIIWGGRFAAFLPKLGSEEKGIYADCSKRENRHISYCQAKDTDEARTWRSMKKGKVTPFTLYER